MEGFSVLHPSLFPFLAAGNSKVLPSAPDHAGMLQMRSRTRKSHPCLGAAAGTRWTTWLRDSRYSQAWLGKRAQPASLFPAVLSLPGKPCNQADFDAILLLLCKIHPSLSLCWREASGVTARSDRGSVQLAARADIQPSQSHSQHKGLSVRDRRGLE